MGMGIGTGKDSMGMGKLDFSTFPAIPNVFIVNWQIMST